jgi:hypothetical protein
MLRTTLALVAALALAGCMAGRHHHEHGGVSAGGQGYAYATTTVNCGGKDHVISTGTASGKCAIVYGDGGKAVGGSCQDGANTSSVNCTLNDGKGGCGSDTTGSGSCTPK